MSNQTASKIAFNIIDRITEVSPSLMKKYFEKLIISLAGSKLLFDRSLKKCQQKMGRIKNYEKILVVADVNIGDSIIAQPSFEVLRTFFKDSQIDYICNQKGGEMIYGNPAVSNVYKIFGNSGFPKPEDLAKIKNIVDSGNYDVIINLSPFLKKSVFANTNNVIDLFIPLAYYFVYLWRLENEQLNNSYVTHTFFQKFLQPFFPVDVLNSDGSGKFFFNTPFTGNSIYLSDNSVKTAEAFIIENDLKSKKRLMMFNPIATSKYTTIPENLQFEIINNCVKSEHIDAVLICEGKTVPGMESKIIKSISSKYFSKIIIVPFKISLSVYASLIDYCDVFLSGDTGPIHIAAAKKISLSPDVKLRNSTSVISVFGSTDSRMYGYDTYKNGHFTSNQSAPAKAYSGRNDCRNITCLHKLAKTCKEVKCFDNLDANVISNHIDIYFRHVRDIQHITKKIKAQV